MRLALPQLQASVYGPALIAQVRSLPADGRGAGPCAACGYLARDWDDLNAGTRFSCEGSADAVPAPTAQATMSFPHLCAIAAQLAVGELFRQLLGLGLADESGAGSLLEYCGFHAGTTRTPLLRKRDCPIEHEAWLVRCVEPGVTALTPRELGRVGGYDDLREVSIRVDHHSFASHTACGCEPHPALGIFHPEGMPLPGPCPACGHERVLHPLYTYREVPGGALSGHLDHSLAELGVRAEPPVLVRGPSGSTLIRSSARRPIAHLGLRATSPLVCSGEGHVAARLQRRGQPGGLAAMNAAPTHSSKQASSGSRSEAAEAAERLPGLADLPTLPLTPQNQSTLDQSSAQSLGSPSWRHRKRIEARGLIALSQIAPRLAIRHLDLQTDLVAVVELRDTPVPCMRPGQNDIELADGALLAIRYPEAILVGPIPGTLPVRVLEPRDVFHTNVAYAERAPALCLGANVPRGFPLREIVLTAYGALTLQAISFDALDPAGVLNPQAATWYQANRARVPLTDVSFLDWREAAASRAGGGQEEERG